MWSRPKSWTSACIEAERESPNGMPPYRAQNPSRPTAHPLFHSASLPARSAASAASPSPLAPSTTSPSTGRRLHWCGRPDYPLRLGKVGVEVSPDGRWLTFARKLRDGVTSCHGHEDMCRTALWIRNVEIADERILMDPTTPVAIDHHPSWNIRVLPGYNWARYDRSLAITQGDRIRGPLGSNRHPLETTKVQSNQFMVRATRNPVSQDRKLAEFDSR